ncbi:hypothetical protein SAMD00019534_015740 [Acytostelium subglobosum LB1]|uniref:hypothetical protein n=1 Tax=Acytostelium subglobosum LB1 TaxID=1410327 RepID=UPI0006451A72|nr:hypothetical protein SAMD00019534_015740 [Acytostelium subglobosum LB1]GAM18399.1 hypothetical protein SAMD00019534_015740 [Acytostelium subglobosum LB1]|eukprot:XP_012757619.1 hypothetical protein SAMD00019534_015740 [Acytostelium subglobosum LB1]
MAEKQQQQQSPPAAAAAVSPYVLATRKYDKEAKQLTGREVERHPLIAGAATLTTAAASTTAGDSTDKKNEDGSSSAKAETTVVNPLQPQQVTDFVDPLSKVANETKVNDPLASSIATMGGLNTIKSSHQQKQMYHDDTYIPWATMKPGILQQYTDDEHNPIQVSFMSTGTSGKVKISLNRLNKILEELDQDSEEKQSTQLTQTDVLMDLETLHSELLKAWRAEERVRSLKIAIQTAKLLSNTSLIKFYPSKWVIASEILDIFGNMVYDRIKSRLKQSLDKDPSKRNEQLHIEQAKETCRNWFYKIASIRELLPRLYIEIAILRCYEFIQGDHNTVPREVVDRLNQQIRGVGNPLVANYLRAYLARRAHDLVPEYKAFIIEGLKDFVFSQRLFEKSKYLEQTLKAHKITLTDYLGLYSPSLEWLLQCLSHNGKQEVLEEVLAVFRESKNSLLLNHIISSFPPDYICNNSTMFSNFIKEADSFSYPKCQLYSTFGVNLVLGHPPKTQVLTILNDVWKVVSVFESLKDYIMVAEVFIEYVLTHCTIKETDTFLKDILRHIIPDKAYENLQSHLQSIVLKILTHVQDFNVLVGITNFLPLLDLFNGESQKQISRSTLEALSSSNSTISDPVLINTFLVYGKALHDSLNSLSFQDEVRQVTNVVNVCIDKFDFGKDVEKQLNFYVDCRQTFVNFDGVKNRLVYAVVALCQKTLALVKGKHTAKTSAFIRACIAYCFITIPSINDVFMKMNLYMVSAAIALQNQALSQADALLKAAITFVQEIPPIMEYKQVRSTEEWTVSYLSNFVSLLVVAPGHPESGPFYLVKALHKVVKDYPWEKGTTGKAKIMVQLMGLCSTWAQDSLPYHFDKVESNDHLFAADPDFISELNELYGLLIKDVLSELNLLKDEIDPSTQRKMVYVCLELVNVTLSVAELNSKTASLIFNLYNMAKKSIPATAHTELTYLKNTLAHIGTLKSKMANDLYNKLNTITA